MRCQIKCRIARPRRIQLKKHGAADDKEVTWFTKDTGVTYCVELPPGIFTACLVGIGCQYKVKDGLSVTLTLDPSAPSSTNGIPYSISVCEGTLPADCPVHVLTPPEIIVSDNKKKARPAAVKKSAPKKKAK